MDDSLPLRRRKIGELLMEFNAITPSELSLALREQKRLNQSTQRKFKLGEIMLFLKMIPMGALHAALLQQSPPTAAERAELTRLRETSIIAPTITPSGIPRMGKRR